MKNTNIKNSRSGDNPQRQTQQQSSSQSKQRSQKQSKQKSKKKQQTKPRHEQSRTKLQTSSKKSSSHASQSKEKKDSLDFLTKEQKQSLDITEKYLKNKGSFDLYNKIFQKHNVFPLDNKGKFSLIKTPYFNEMKQKLQTAEKQKIKMMELQLQLRQSNRNLKIAADKNHMLKTQVKQLKQVNQKTRTKYIQDYKRFHKQYYDLFDKTAKVRAEYKSYNSKINQQKLNESVQRRRLYPSQAQTQLLLRQHHWGRILQVKSTEHIQIQPTSECFKQCQSKFMIDFNNLAQYTARRIGQCQQNQERAVAQKDKVIRELQAKIEETVKENGKLKQVIQLKQRQEYENRMNQWKSKMNLLVSKIQEQFKDIDKK